jgi:hypothetical protein
MWIESSFETARMKRFYLSRQMFWSMLVQLFIQPYTVTASNFFLSMHTNFINWVIIKFLCQKFVVASSFILLVRRYEFFDSSSFLWIRSQCSPSVIWNFSPKLVSSSSVWRNPSHYYKTFSELTPLPFTPHTLVTSTHSIAWAGIREPCLQDHSQAGTSGIVPTHALCRQMSRTYNPPFIHPRVPRIL